MHRTTPRFWRHFEQLPEPTQRLARQNFALLMDNPRHPSLRFRKVGNYWSVRIGLAHRAIAIEDDNDFIWLWIGGHDDYIRLVNG